MVIPTPTVAYLIEVRQTIERERGGKESEVCMYSRTKRRRSVDKGV